MRRRTLAPYVRSLLGRFPAVALLGPRQCGKTTLARSLGHAYYDLEDEAERTRLDVEWPAMEKRRELVIFDEAQEHPALFSRLRGSIDRDRRRNGRFLLLGSVSPALMKNVSESLAGRLATTELTPFLAFEVPVGKLDLLWHVGGYPDGGILGGRAYPRWQEEYARLLAQRDLPAWGLTARPQVTLRLLKMTAAVHGQVWNASEIGRSLGLSYHTVNGYLDYLEGAFLVRRLPAFSTNLRKRLVKSPKLFWRDSGVLHALLGLQPGAALLNQPWVGASWEGFVIEQALGTLAAQGRSADASFLRTKEGEEIDMVLDVSGERWAVEVKLTASPSPADLSRLDKYGDMIRATRRILVSRLPGIHGTRERAMADVPGFLNLLSRDSRSRT